MGSSYIQVFSSDYGFSKATRIGLAIHSQGIHGLPRLASEARTLAMLRS